MSDASRPFVQLFTDGACRGNPGPGGWGYILRHPASGKEMEGSGGQSDSTNNQMELMAIISGLEALKTRSSVEIVTDSSYVKQGCEEWMSNWKLNDWKRRDRKKWVPVKNQELWQRLDALLSRHECRFQIVRGHTGHPENERCDELAVAAALKFS